MSTAIAVFCKTPGLSPTKTRLGAEIGIELAEEFYLGSIAAVEEVLLTVEKSFGNKVKIYWALAEEEAFGLPLWSKFSKIGTGTGGLGARIYHVFHELFNLHEQVIVLGSDSPQITYEYLQKAINGLSDGNCDGVIGPCSDGGFVLFGCNKIISKITWTEVRYSQSDTLQQLLKQLDQVKYQYKMLPTLGDVDEYDDLINVLNDFLHQDLKLLPAQKKLSKWIQSILISKMFICDIKEKLINR